MNDNLTEIIAILDASGSMYSVKSDTIGGFNSFVEKQKTVDGEANITLVTFSDTFFKDGCTKVWDGEDINKVPKLTENQYYPIGRTSLLDAIGKTVDSVGKRLNDTPEPEKPGKVIVLIMTDGLENASKEYTLDNIKEKISTQENIYKWEFIFIGADIDSFSEGKNMGFSSSKTINFAKNTGGIKDIFETISDNTTLYRCNNITSMAFFDEDYSKQKKYGVDNP